MQDQPTDVHRHGNGLAPHPLPATSTGAAKHGDPLDWTRVLEEMPSSGAAGKHRRTYSAPPALKNVHSDHPGLSGKRSARSPRGVSAGLAFGVDPFQDIRSPVYKKYLPADEQAASEDSSFMSKEAPTVRHGERGGPTRRVRAHSFDDAVYELQRFDEMAAGRGASSKRGGGAKRNDAANPTDGASGETGGTARDMKTVPWTSSEDKVICEGVEEHGFKWSLISLTLPGRTDNAVRNRWHRLEQARRWREEMQAQYQAASANGAPINPIAMPGSAYPGYKCRRCGQPKRGHVCPYEDSGGLPLPSTRPSSHQRPGKAERQARAPAPQHAQAAASFHHQQPPAGAHGGPGARERLQPPALQRPASAQYISVLPPTSAVEVRAAMMAGQLPTPSPQRYLLEHLSTMPLSAHVRSLESGMDGELINVGDLGARTQRAHISHAPPRSVPALPDRRGAARHCSAWA